MIQGLRLWPIVAGLLVDLVGSVVVAVGFVTVTMGAGAFAGNVSTEPLVMTTSDYIITEVVGLLPDVAGGYVAGRLARVRPLAHGLSVGIALLVMILVLEVMVPDSEAPLWFTALSLIGVVPAAVIGGWLAAKASAGRSG